MVKYYLSYILHIFFTQRKKEEKKGTAFNFYQDAKANTLKFKLGNGAQFC